MRIFGKKYKTGIALSGGAVRGIAHLGVLQAIEEKKIKIGMISGTSAGALAGAFYADGFSPKEILNIFSNKKLFEFMRFSFPRSGFFNVTGLKKLLSNTLRTKNIEDLKIPLVVAATNFQKGAITYFDKGLLVDLLLASSSIPLLFETTKIDGIPYIDGGIMDNLPIEPLKNKCKRIIAVHTNPLGEQTKINNPIQVVERAFHLSVASEINSKKQEVDVFIEPEKLKDYGLLDLKKAKSIFEIGYEAALAQFNTDNLR
ncbi:MAG: patatin-like phospholipase family protein [Bacteroidales bacterium]|nr:patatin-like phospholipase family protein [Bacteroidales bacterium]